MKITGAAWRQEFEPSWSLGEEITTGIFTKMQLATLPQTSHIGGSLWDHLIPPHIYNPPMPDLPCSAILQLLDTLG